MNIFILVLILLLFVTGAVGLVLGRKGINKWTLVGAWLVLMSSLVFISLAGRVAERERVWRKEIRDLESKIAAEAGGPLAEKRVFLGDSPDEASADEKAWREKAIKLLQQAGGTLAEKLTKGRVDLAIENSEGEPPPKAAEWDIQVLSRDEFIAEAEKSLDALSKTVRLQQREKIAAESWRNRYWKSSLFKPPTIQLNEDQTGLYDVTEDGVIELELGGTGELPLNVGAELAVFFPDMEDRRGFLGIFIVNKVERSEEKILSATIQPLTKPDERDLKTWDKWNDFFKGAAKVPELLVFEDLPTVRLAATIKPDDGKPAEQEVPLDEALDAIAAGQSLPGEYWAEVTVENSAALENVNEGTTLELDLQTADKLQQDGAVKIQRIVHRRLLVDPLTALRGTRFEKIDVPTAGIEGIRGKLTAELTSLSLMIGRIDSAKQATMNENKIKKETLTALGNDKKAWEEDLAFAGQALGRLEERVEKTNADLADARRAVVQMRTELGELTAQIMAKSSLPGQRSAAGDPAARRAVLP